MTQGKLFFFLGLFFSGAVLVERAVCDGRAGFGAAAWDGLRSASFVRLYFSYFSYNMTLDLLHISHIFLIYDAFLFPLCCWGWGGLAFGIKVETATGWAPHARHLLQNHRQLMNGFVN